MAGVIYQTADEYIQNSLNKKYGEIDKISLATQAFKQNINIGEAVVNIIGATGIAGFRFNLPEREQIKLQSEITDHYTDVNNPIQDQIALKPILITLTGLQGEYFYSVNEMEDLIAKITPTLSLIKQFIPKLPNNTKQVLAKKYKNMSNKENIPSSLLPADDTDFNAIDLFSLFQNMFKLASSQTRAYYFFEALWKSKARFSVETTWKKFDNMAVESIEAIRDNNADITSFSITVKQLSFTQTKTDSVENVVGRLKEMLGKVENKGIDKGKKVQAINAGGNA